MKQTISRFLPLSVKGRLRKTVDLFQYKIARFSRANRFLPPPFLTNVGNSDFIETGNEFFTYFVDLGQLKPSDKVLDVGCGSGRMARRLTEYLTTGSYDGIDITKDSIDWANKTYSGFPNFRFHFSDIFNKYYNPKGTVSAEEYRFPFDDAQFDFVFLTSVFTHMLERDVQNYLSEIRRVLRSGGCAFITCFLLNEFYSWRLFDSRYRIPGIGNRLPGTKDACFLRRQLPETRARFSRKMERAKRRFELSGYNHRPRNLKLKFFNCVTFA
jgi:SAM-dependent methyltransferase